MIRLSIHQAKLLADELVNGAASSKTPDHLVGWMWEVLKQDMGVKEEAELNKHFEQLFEADAKQVMQIQAM